jgi:hypothetical protein
MEMKSAANAVESKYPETASDFIIHHSIFDIQYSAFLNSYMYHPPLTPITWPVT